jgi:hypothetical protein
MRMLGMMASRRRWKRNVLNGLDVVMVVQTGGIHRGRIEILIVMSKSRIYILIVSSNIRAQFATVPIGKVGVEEKWLRN